MPSKKATADALEKAMPTIGADKKRKVPLSPAMKKIATSEPATMDEALQNAQDLIDEQGDSDVNITKIRSFDGDIRAFESRIKTIRERMVEVLENTNEYDAVLELEEKLKAARADLKRRLEADSEYMHLTEEMADEKLSLRDAKQNMSDFLLAYFADTRERQIELAPQYAREVLLTGKLGKAKDFQTNIFSRPPIDENRKDLQ